MEVKLIKHGHSYALLKDRKLIAFAHPEDFCNEHTIGKLSLKNCEAIANGYDLDELAETFAKNHSIYPTAQDDTEYGFKNGFQKALEILGDKKFSEEDIRKAFFHVHNEPTFDVFKKSLQQTEWDVIVEMESIPADRAPNGWDTFPKLDVDGCLILKHK